MSGFLERAPEELGKQCTVSQIFFQVFYTWESMLNSDLRLQFGLLIAVSPPLSLHCLCCSTPQQFCEALRIFATLFLLFSAFFWDDVGAVPPRQM